MRIAARFDGRAGSASGGITAGRLAAYVGLRVDVAGGTAPLLDGDVLVAEAVPSTVEVDAGPPVGVDQAAATVFPGA